MLAAVRRTAIPAIVAGVDLADDDLWQFTFKIFVYLVKSSMTTDPASSSKQAT